MCNWVGPPSHRVAPRSMLVPSLPDSRSTMPFQPDDDLLIPFALDAAGAKVRPANAAERISIANGYRCPACQAVVRLKDGGRRRRHFAHMVSTSTCVLTKAGGESDRHRRAKDRVVAAVRGIEPAQIQRRCRQCSTLVNVWFDDRITEAALEHRVTERRIADVALLDAKGAIHGAVEVRASHRVDALKQEDYARLPWVELDATEVLASAIWLPHRDHLGPLRCPTCTERKRRFEELEALARRPAPPPPPRPTPPSPPPSGPRPMVEAALRNPADDELEDWMLASFPVPDDLDEEAVAVYVVWITTLEKLLLPRRYRPSRENPYLYILEFPVYDYVGATLVPPDIRVTMDVSAMRLARVATAAISVDWEALAPLPPHVLEKRLVREIYQLRDLPFTLARPDEGSLQFKLEMGGYLEAWRRRFALACYDQMRQSQD